ncbi:MAG: CotH kinase family protein [candidate division KSB1 bacterium]|nr:CotH kinase family protein [candidate division KSB1 bacterium]MDZ7276265.1 CotH kinase family protein [candidate division KSB1 bacterium]MDZ7287929.1 CotH kinase family protein [candidate division KSB1 bacterium]MDZ7300058.1 CotH kinase family protein [candidate division KSB1 bacterium]MDZ7307300.1 CotH kinase family protein [candidate division KSB1 bacterium]
MLTKRFARVLRSACRLSTPAVLYLAALLSPLFAQGQTPQVEFTSSNLPIVVIDTHGREIVDEPKITADMGIIDNGPGRRNYLSDPFNHYHGRIGIEIRGSSSQMFPKKQYGFETRDSLGKDIDVALMGMPAESDWILSASYSDKTLMRNVLAYHLARQLGRYASRTRFCELVLNGDYRGVYIFMEKIKRDKNRVNISKLEPADVAGDAVTGGYLIKIDKREGSDTQGWYSSFLPYPGSPHRIYYQYDYPDPDDLVPAQQSYIQDFIHRFESLMAGPDYNHPQTGYLTLLDPAAAVDYFLINEVSRNVDGYRLSAFMHKDRDSKNGRLTMGPVWDYDLAFGNADYYDGAKIYGWQVDFRVESDGFQIPFWWPRLVRDSTFARLLVERWRSLRTTVFDVQRIHAFIDSTALLLEEAQQRNFQRWPILGVYVWPNAYIGQNYREEVEYLKHWVNLRILWMDASLPGLAVAVKEARTTPPEQFTLRQNYPNPFNPETTIRFHLPAGGRVSLTILAGDGRRVATLWEGDMSHGEHVLRWQARGLASGVYFCRLQAGEQVAVRKLMIAR